MTTKNLQKKYLREWNKHAKHNIDAAELLFAKNGSLETICCLVYRAVEKHLKGFLYLHQNNFQHNNSLPKLLKLCSEYEAHAIDYLNNCEDINAYYQPYPLATPQKHSKIEVKEIIEKGKSLIKYILKQSK